MIFSPLGHSDTHGYGPAAWQEPLSQKYECRYYALLQTMEDLVKAALSESMLCVVVVVVERAGT